MKKCRVGLGSLALLLMMAMVFTACPTEATGDDPQNPVTTRVVTPRITAVPNRAFNNAPIQITLATTTADAGIYYTLDGTAPTASSTLYAGPFSLMSSDTANTPYRGYVSLQVIGIKEGHTNSNLSRKNFQIFPKEPIGNHSGTEFGTSTTGRNGGVVRVEITLVDGFIDTLNIVTGYGNTAMESPEFWPIAYAHAMEFLPLMNSWELDVITGASYSSTAIRDAARQAIEKFQ
jgi:uncharacterized protein with FMN-binding domain